MLLFKWGVLTIQKGNATLLSNSLLSNIVFPVIIERSKKNVSEIDILPFLSSSSRG